MEPRAIILAFVREQSCGEWDEKTIHDDAAAIEALVRAAEDRALEVGAQMAERTYQGGGVCEHIAKVFRAMKDETVWRYG